jgi:hypothetical protein
MPERPKYTRRAGLFRSLSDGYQMLDSPLFKPYQRAAEFFDKRAAESENKFEEQSPRQSQGC